MLRNPADEIERVLAHVEETSPVRHAEAFQRRLRHFSALLENVNHVLCGCGEVDLLIFIVIISIITLVLRYAKHVQIGFHGFVTMPQQHMAENTYRAAIDCCRSCCHGVMYESASRPWWSCCDDIEEGGCLKRQ